MHLGKKRLHLNPHGTGKLAVNFLKISTVASLYCYQSNTLNVFKNTFIKSEGASDTNNLVYTNNSKDVTVETVKVIPNMHFNSNLGTPYVKSSVSILNPKVYVFTLEVNTFKMIIEPSSSTRSSDYAVPIIFTNCNGREVIPQICDHIISSLYAIVMQTLWKN